jgi:hypothetical protein
MNGEADVLANIKCRRARTVFVAQTERFPHDCLVWSEVSAWASPSGAVPIIDAYAQSIGTRLEVNPGLTVVWRQAGGRAGATGECVRYHSFNGWPLRR